MTELYFGFDPGGKSGVAVARVEGDAVNFKSADVASVDEAFAWFRGIAEDTSPAGVGIDALLSWSTSAGGWRPSDRALRKTYRKMAPSVICSNSAYGAMAVQGMTFAFRAKAEWRSAVLNEVHPKVLLYALDSKLVYPRKWQSGHEKACQWFKDRQCSFDELPKSEHAFDAVLGAWATYKGLRSKEWSADLSKLDRDCSSALCPIPDVHYFWPEQLTAP